MRTHAGGRHRRGGDGGRAVSRVDGRSVAIVGVPWDGSSSYLRGAALAPTAIRDALWSPSSNAWTERGSDLAAARAAGRFRDAGDLDVGVTAPDAVTRIADGIGRVLATGQRVLALGGDHSVTYPILRAHGEHGVRPSILHVDAHADLYDEFDGDRLSHACPFARIMEAGLASRLVQVGVRTLTAHQRAQAGRFGVEIVEMRDWRRDLEFDLEGPVYVSLDLDGLDPAFAPGVSHHEPGGLATRDVIALLHALESRIVGADVVELNPTRDVNGMTAMVAARFVKELAGLMLEA
jgi:agmatinase